MDCNISFLVKSGVDGPGNRIGIWFQGCSKDCPGCFNQVFRERKQGFYSDLSEIKSSIRHMATVDVEGITLSGGEPLDQLSAVTDISSYARSIGLSVMIYTGYEPESMSLDRLMCLRMSADIAVVGPYDCRVPAVHAWAGSGNQRILTYSGRYSAQDIVKGGVLGKFEVRISSDGYIVTGFPPRSIYGD